VGLVVGEVGALGFEELLGDVLAQRLGDDLVVLQRVEGLTETAWQGRDSKSRRGG
jgi:hypothetical protein